MRLMAREVTVRQEKFEEVVRESRRQEVRVQECVGVAVSEEMSRSDERLRGVLRDLKGQIGVLQRELREGMGRVQRGMGKESGTVSDDESAASTERDGMRGVGKEREEKSVYEGQQGSGAQLFAGPLMQWFGGGRGK
jgi:hypothetical protein